MTLHADSTPAYHHLRSPPKNEMEKGSRRNGGRQKQENQRMRENDDKKMRAKQAKRPKKPHNQRQMEAFILSHGKEYEKYEEKEVTATCEAGR